MLFQLSRLRNLYLKTKGNIYIKRIFYEKKLNNTKQRKGNNIKNAREEK